jgi:hypothetical protein
MAKQRLVEGALFTAQYYKKVDTSLKEAVVGGKTYFALGVYTFPFTRPGQKNLNGRIYPHALWDRVFAQYKNQSTLGLMNHPDDDGDPKNIWCVWKNLRYNEDKTLGVADCYIIDNEWGKTAIGVLENDGPVGLSSSGLGDFEADGITVTPGTFELERVSDWVLNPSYSVFGTMGDRKENVKSTESDKELIKESKQMNTLTLREKRELEASLKKIYENVKIIPDLKERLSRAKESLTFYEGEDVGGVESYKKEFEDLVAEAEKELEDKLKSAEDFEEIKKESAETRQKAKEKSKEAEVLKKENEELKKENEKLRDKVKESSALKDASEELLKGMTEDAKRQVKWEKYEELRQYAIGATTLYSEMKTDRNLLQIKVQELENNLKAIQNTQMQEYQKVMSEKSRIEEIRQRSAESKILRDKQLAEAREKALLERVNPEVMTYWQDLMQVDEALASKYRKEILSRKTETEAQMFVLKAKHGRLQQEREMRPPEGFQERNLSRPLPMKNFRDTIPDVPMLIPKGFI